MIDQAFIDDRIGGWFEVVSLTTEKYPAWRAAAVQAESELDPDRAFALIHLAFNRSDDNGRDWLEACIKAHDTDFIAHHADELTTRVAALAAIQHLSNDGGDYREVVALLVQSAVFLRLEPSIADLIEAASSFLGQRADEARVRDPLLNESTPDLVGRLMKEGQPDEEGVTLTPDEQLGLRDSVIHSLAQRIDSLVDGFGKRLASLDEEINTLWWSYSRRSRDLLVPWSEVSPIERRIVRSASELATLTKAPRPLTIGGLLRAAIGTDDDVTLATIAESLHADSLAPNSAREDLLLPLTSAAKSIAALTSSDDTWKTVTERTLNLDVTLAVSAVSAAEQLLREYELAELL